MILYKEVTNEELEMINLIKNNLQDDIKLTEDFLIVIANTDSHLLRN